MSGSGAGSGGGIRPRPLLWLAAACACVLVAALGVEYHSAVKRETRLAHSLSLTAAAASPGQTRQSATSPPLPSASPSAALVAGWSRMALARPLFSRSRRPVTTAAAGPRQPRLAGIVVGPSGARAIFAGENDARGIVAGVGQQAGDWKVLAIATGSVQVSGPAGLRTLRPSRDPNAAAATPALPEHPSILDLLRARPLNLGPGLSSGGPFVGGTPR